MKYKVLSVVAIASLLSSCSSNSTKVNTEITAGEVKEHISFLASDSLKGRKPGTPEGKIAGEYIAKEFEKAGLQKLGDSYFQNLEVVSNVKEGESNEFKFADKNLELGVDYRPLAFSANTEKEAEVVFAGYGIEYSSDSLSWNDYANVDVKDKWVMILRQDPDVDNLDSPLISLGTERAKVLTASDKGAAGVLVVSGVNTEKKDILDDLYFDKSSSRSDLPVIQISRVLANKILASSGKNIEDLESEMIKNMQTVNFATGESIYAKTDIVFEKAKTRNIIAKIEGSDPELKDEVIILGAHYDHLGMGGPGSGSRAVDTIAVHNGADDNASGVAGIIEIAQKMAVNKPKRSVVFMGFAAEEMGLLGSKFFTENPLVEAESIKMMLNFDMIGRLDSTNALTIGGTGTTPVSEDLINKFAEGKNLSIAMSKEGSGPSDHSAFYVKNIPVLFFFTGIHPDYHTPADDVEKINFEGEKRVLDLGYDLAMEFANMPEAPEFVQVDVPSNKSNRRKLKVTFGIVPDFSGNSTAEGMAVDGVTPDGAAEKGGMQKGDVITAINGKKVSNIYDYMARLGRLKKGERCNVDVMRNGENVVLILEL